MASIKSETIVIVIESCHMPSNMVSTQQIGLYKI